MYTQVNGYIVIQELANSAYQPVFRQDEIMCFYSTIEDAQEDIKDLAEEIESAISLGYMDSDSRFQPGEYTIVPATLINPWSEKSEQIIICFIEWICYALKRKEDDWREINITI